VTDLHDVTAKAGVGHSGWGQACCVGDCDNDGWDDLFVTYYGQNVLFTTMAMAPSPTSRRRRDWLQPATRWNSGCAFLDYDRDGHLDLFVGNYIDFDLKTAPLPESGPCLYKGILVACGPPGLAPGKNSLYHNKGDGTSATSRRSPACGPRSGITRSVPRSRISTTTGWPDIYVANDSTAATLYQNQKDGTFRDVAIEDGRWGFLPMDGRRRAWA